MGTGKDVEVHISNGGLDAKDAKSKSTEAG